MEHKVREPARTIDMVPYLVHRTILSARKFSNGDYISIFDVNEVNIYDVQTAKIKYQRRQY